MKVTMYEDVERLKRNEDFYINGGGSRRFISTSRKTANGIIHSLIVKQWGSDFSMIRHDDEDNNWSFEGPEKIMIRENDFKIDSKIKHVMILVKDGTELNDVINSTLLSDVHYALTGTKDKVVARARGLIYNKLVLGNMTEANEKRNHKLLDRLRDLDDDEILGIVDLEGKIRNMDDKDYTHSGDRIDSDGNQISVKHNQLANDWAIPMNDEYTGDLFDSTANGSMRAEEYLDLVHEAKKQGAYITDTPDVLVFSNSDGEYLTMSERDGHTPTSDDVDMACAINPEDTIFMVDVALPWMA